MPLLHLCCKGQAPRHPHLSGGCLFSQCVDVQRPRSGWAFRQILVADGVQGHMGGLAVSVLPLCVLLAASISVPRSKFPAHSRFALCLFVWPHTAIQSGHLHISLAFSAQSCCWHASLFLRFACILVNPLDPLCCMQACSLGHIAGLYHCFIYHSWPLPLLPLSLGFISFLLAPCVVSPHPCVCCMFVGAGNQNFFQRSRLLCTHRASMGENVGGVRAQRCWATVLPFLSSCMHA